MHQMKLVYKHYASYLLAGRAVGEVSPGPDVAIGSVWPDLAGDCDRYADGMMR